MFKTQINRLLLAVVLFNLCAVIGCHRGYYRRQADADAKRLILQKSVDPRWNTASGTIDIDPQSRMFDPFSADHPPIPPDDPASHQLMHCVDGKPGYPQWNANGDTNFVENPEWRRYLPVNDKGEVVLTLDGAFQLALIHSPDYQEAHETLYLSALDVSLERFGFDTTLIGGYNSFFTSQGRFRGSRESGANPPAANGTSSSTIQGQLGANGGGFDFRRIGITGTTFAVGLANTILFNFSGNNTQSGSTLIDFSIIQPLLRGAGRDRIMEALTQAERTLLANVRQLERFRRAFYLQIAIGRNLAVRLTRAGDFLGIPGAAGTNAGGYFGLLERQQRIRNQELNVRQLESVLSLFREFFLRERLDAVQLKLFETRVYEQQRNLLDLRVGYQTLLDQFKRTLGLPPDLDVVIDDTYLERFKLISDQVNEQLILSSALRENTGSVLNGVDELFDELESVDDIATGKFVWPSDLAEKISKLIPYIEEAEATIEKIVNEDRLEIEADINYLNEKRNERVAYLDKLRIAIESGKINSPVDPRLFETESLPETAELRQILADSDSKDSILNRAARVKAELANIKSRIAGFKQTESELEKQALYEFVRTEFQEKIPGQLSEINSLILEISLLQARTRSNSIEIVDVDINSTQAIEIARCMRRDWMNARASLVDNWRNIEFVADQLESQLDLVFEGDMGSRNGESNPFKIRYETGQLRAGFRFDAPIVRQAERNNYRAALISYQQTRRAFYQFEDSVKQNLREISRNIDRNKVLFELDRRTVQVQIESVEINRYELEKPVGPGATGGGRLGATTAQNLANAIIGLNGAQNSFLGSWVGYEVLRRNLDFDLGTMQLDELGQWIDPGKIDASIGQRAAATMGIELDCQFCTGVAAPGGIAADLISDPAPSIIEPQPDPLQFESEIPVPAEVERINRSSAPQLNQPNSAMRPRRSVFSSDAASSVSPPNRVPGLLFQPVNSRSESTFQRSTENSLQRNQFQSQPVAIPPRKVIRTSGKGAAARPLSVSKTTNSSTESPLPRNEMARPVAQQNSPVSAHRQPLFPSQGLKNPQLSRSSQVQPASSAESVRSLVSVSDRTTRLNPLDVPAADRNADPFTDPMVKRTSGLSPEVNNQGKPSNPFNPPTMTLQAVTGGMGPTPLTNSKEMAAATTGISNHPAFAESPDQDPSWQFPTSSLGGVLNRFRTDSER